jgi:pyrophosphatase PpaX
MGYPLLEQLRFFTGKEQVDELAVKYRKFNLGKHDELVAEFPNVREVLAELRRRNIRMGVVTNKMRITTLMGLKLCGLDSYMETLVTIDDVVRGKPDPEAVLKALEQMKADPGEAIMVGDSQYDIIAGRDAGVKTVGVSWSLKGEDHLRTFQPDYVIRDMRDLLEIVG